MNKLLTRAEYDEWVRSLPPNTCTFCQWQNYQRVIHEFKHWIWVDNIAPYWYFHTMFVPKRHFTKEQDMTIEEMAELVTAKQYAFDLMLQLKLEYPNTKRPVEKFVYFHRFRLNRFDPISGTIRPDHYHDHFSPDIDHRWDKTLDEDAFKYPVSELVKAVKK